jgi:hypothetical protein
MANEFLDDQIPYPGGALQAGDQLWLSRDNGDTTRTSYHIDPALLLAMASNLFTSNGTINNNGVTTGIARTVNIGDGSVLTFNFNGYQVTMSPGGLTIIGEQFINKSQFIEAGETVEIDYPISALNIPQQAEISIVGGGDLNSYISYKAIKTFQYTGPDTVERDNFTLVSVGDDLLFGITIAPRTGAAGFRVTFENLSLTQQRWSIRTKYNIV